MWKPSIYHREVVSTVTYSSSHKPGCVSTLGSTHVPINVSNITPCKNPLPLGAFGLITFNHPCTYEMHLVYPPSALIPIVLFKFLAEHVTDQFRFLILVAPCWMEAPLLPTVLGMLEDIPPECPIIRNLIIDILIERVLKGLQLLHLTLLLLREVCCTDKSSLPESVR